MLTKVQLFEQWRGEKALEEKNILEIAMVVSNYIRSVKQLATIKTDFSSSQSEQYKALNKYSQRSISVLLFFKLEIDEVLDQIPSVERIEWRLLSEVNEILIGFYNGETSNITQKIANLMGKIKQLLELNFEELEYKKQARVLCFALYTGINILWLSLNKLNFAGRMAISVFVDIEKIKKEMAFLSQLIEVKISQLDKLRAESLKKNNSLLVKNAIQDHFNERFLALLKRDSRDALQFILLEDRMAEVINGIDNLLDKRIQKEEIISAIKKIEELLNAAEDNDKKISGRKYFLDFVDSNRDLFYVLMNNLGGFKKVQLTEKIAALNTSNLSSQVFYGISWATSWIAMAYRYIAPTALQNASSKITTLDSESKSQLKYLAQECLNNLNRKLAGTDKEIGILIHQLSNGTPELIRLISNESSKNLTLLLEANSAAKEVMSEYRRIANSLEGIAFHLNVVKECTASLTEFIQRHDGFLVRLSNLLANISSIFKSDTAAMIDSAREMKEQLEFCELDYKRDLIDGLRVVENNPEINDALKDRLQQKIEREMNKKTQMLPGSVPSKQNVRYLIHNMKKMFNPAQNKSIFVAGHNTQAQNEVVFPSLS